MATPARFPWRMRSKPRWVGWIWGDRSWRRYDRSTLAANDGHLWHVDENGVMSRVDKLPIDVRTGYAASVDKPNTWASFEDAFAALLRGVVDGIGYVLDDGEVLVDLDGCMLDGEPDEFARSVMGKLDSYSERSVSGEGVHVVVVADGFTPNRGVKGARCEVYAGGHTNRYCTVTGDVLMGRDELNDDAEDVMGDFYETEFSENPIVSAEDESRARAVMDEVRVTDLTDEDSRAVAWMCGHYRHGRDMYQRGDYLGWAKDRIAYWRLQERLKKRLKKEEGPPDVSASVADAALASYLLAATNGDTDRTLTLLHCSGMWRPKYDEIHDGTHPYCVMTVGRIAGKVDAQKMRAQAIARRDRQIDEYPFRMGFLADLMRRDDVTDGMLRHVMAHYATGRAQRRHDEPVEDYPDELVGWIVGHWDRIASLAYRFEFEWVRR